jgi:catechol 2,3-dioxygenase-like lactoylglutathione lyase family enzyme
MALHFGHIHLLSPDPDKAAQFYVTHFGATISRRDPDLAGAPNVRLKLGGLSLFIRGIRPTDRLAPQPSGKIHGVDHFGIDVDDFDATVERLRAAGLPCVDGPRRAGAYRVAFFQCPENVLVEVLEIVDGKRPSD